MCIISNWLMMKPPKNRLSRWIKFYFVSLKKWPSIVSMQVEFKCSLCQEVFSHQSALTSHIVEQHASTNSSICDLCGKTFSHPSSVIYHKEVGFLLWKFESNIHFAWATGGAQQGSFLRLPDLQQRIQTQAAVAAPLACPFGRQAVRLSRVRRHVQNQGQSLQSQRRAQRGETIPVHALRCQILAQDKSGASHQVAHGRETVSFQLDFSNFKEILSNGNCVI